MVITYTVAGDVSDVDQDAQDAILAGLQSHFSCYPPDCYAVLRVTAASVSLALEMLVPTDAPAVIASAVIAQVQAAASQPLADLSATVGATVEKSPEVAVKTGAAVVVVLAGLFAASVPIAQAAVHIAILF